MVSVAADTVAVLVKSVKETPLSSSVPPRLSAPRPKNGCGGAAASTPPFPPICQRVTVDNSAAHSTLFTFAALPQISTVSPPRFGISNLTGEVRLSAPNCQPPSATTQKLLASGTISHGGDTLSAFSEFPVIRRSCPAPRPRVILATILR